MNTVSSAKEQRYDRQLRLWGDRGQIALENARICLIGAGVIGSELLKNLVLPGIGSFTIVDNALVTEADLGNNFFTTSKDLNKPRAKAVAALLSELNGDVKGTAVLEALNELLENDPGFFLGFTVIIYTDIKESELLRLSRIVSSAHIPIVVCTCVGFIGYLRVSVLEHAIIESHPDSNRPDLRLDRPFPSLIDLADTPVNDIDSLSAHDLAHIPWLLIVHKFVQRFFKSNGHFPSSQADKQEIRKSIRSAAEFLLEECQSRGEKIEPLFELTNFEEACRAVNTAVSETKIPSDVAQIFEECTLNDQSDIDFMQLPENATIKSKSTLQKQNSQSPFPSPLTNLTMQTFWRMVSALKEFTENEGNGCLPLRGDLPDMTSDSARYLRLLSAYQQQADCDVEKLSLRLSNIKGLTMSDIRLFARNAAFIRVMKCRSLEEELKLSPARSEDLHLLPSHEDNDAMIWYFVLRGAASFFSEHGRWPGGRPQPGGFVVDERSTAANRFTREISQSTNDFLFESDLPILRNHVNRILTSSGLATNRVCDDYIQEMCRFGGGVVHSIAAFMGGIAAQEVIKLITHQFVPISQPLIYNGITQRTEIIDF